MGSYIFYRYFVGNNFDYLFLIYSATRMNVIKTDVHIFKWCRGVLWQPKEKKKEKKLFSPSTIRKQRKKGAVSLLIYNMQHLATFGYVCNIFSISPPSHHIHSCKKKRAKKKKKKTHKT